MDNDNTNRTNVASVLRWFGTVRKRDGNLIIASRPVTHAPAQKDFTIGILTLERGDQLLDLFLSDKLEPKGYHDYANEAFRTQEEKQEEKRKERDRKQKREKRA